MARIIGNAFGKISGKIGGLVFVNSKGGNYVRELPAKRKGPIKESVRKQGNKWSFASHFLNPLRPFINAHVKRFNGYSTPYLCAFSHMLKNALSDYPDKIHFNEILVTKGDLPNVDSVNVTKKKEIFIHLKWVFNHSIFHPNGADKVLVIAYCEYYRRYIVDKDAFRRDKSSCIELSDFRNKLVHIWIAFQSYDGKEISNSRYCGKHMVG